MSPPPADQLAAPETRLARQLAILAVGSALFMQFIDQTALSTALPTLADAFHIEPLHLKLVLTSYILIQAVIVPASGWAAERWGPRRVFMGCMAVFLLGSVLCGLSRNLGELVLFRVLQGAGAAMLMPVGRIIVVGNSPREHLVRSMALLTTPAMVGPIIGPPLTGLILKVASWPWIFYINVPVCLLGMLAVWKFVPRQKQPHPGRFDTTGFLLAAVAMACAMGVAETLGFDLVPAWVQAAAGVIAVLAVIAFVGHARRTEKPVLDLTLFRIDSFRASMSGGALVRIGIGATPFLMPLLVQIGLGWSPLKAGFVTMSMAVGALASRPLAARMIRGLGFRNVLLWTAVLVSIFTAAPGLFRASTPLWLMFIVLAVGGFIRATQFTTSNTLSFVDLDHKAVNAASTLSAVVLQLSISMGITVGGLALQLMRIGGSDRIRPEQFTLPFAIVGAISMLSVLVYARLPRGLASDVAGRGRSRR